MAARDRGTALRLGALTIGSGVHLVLGGIIAAGYVVLVSGLAQLARAPDVPTPLTVVLAVIAVPLAITPPLLAPVRDIEIVAARSLLAVDLAVPTTTPSRDDRFRAAGFVITHLLTGAIAVTALLFGVPSAIGMIGRAFGAGGDGLLLSAPDLGWWGLPLGLLTLAALPPLALLGGALLRAVAGPLLGPSASTREEEERRRRVVLAERNRIARELHDGVGHALAITTMQASAADAALGRDEDAARAAIAEIARVGRAAMGDLDRSLAVLREDGAESPLAPRPTLDAVTRLDGVGLHGDARDLAGLPVAMSREAYQIVAEAVVNARRHGAGEVEIDWRRADDRLHLEVSNAVGGVRVGEPGGRGMAGMRERASLIGATVHSGPEEDGWRFVLDLDATR